MPLTCILLNKDKNMGVLFDTGIVIPCKGNPIISLTQLFHFESDIWLPHISLVLDTGRSMTVVKYLLPKIHLKPLTDSLPFFS
jgi:hypothetical protein